MSLKSENLKSAKLIKSKAPNFYSNHNMYFTAKCVPERNGGIKVSKVLRKDLSW